MDTNLFSAVIDRVPLLTIELEVDFLSITLAPIYQVQVFSIINKRHLSSERNIFDYLNST